MKKNFVILIPAIFLFSCAQSPPKNVKSILEKRCDSCHSYKIYKKIKSHDKTKWEKILHRMIIKGARLNEAEFNQLLEYFTSSNK